MARVSSKGFSLIELLVTTAIIGIVTAIAIPAYRTYVETANMTKVNSAYEYAIRLSRQELAKHQTRMSVGLASELPENDEDLIQLLNEGNRIEAPGGGPAYIPKNKKKEKKKDGGEKYGDPELTGAIVIDVKKKGHEINIYRPAYLGLKAFHATVTNDSVDIKEK
ncbi:MAG: prepilin-type N-terminal cleavage/methylation domain-containing protein [Pseudomonadales bacterium]|nr:prepilin-type N-terminal cleavage/methylation domain-containing protein [Pseudomonadales bacterium]